MPREKMRVSDWADTYRMLPVASAVGGAYSTAFAPYNREIMDSFNDERIRRIVVLKSTQLGFTEALLNIIGYAIHWEPQNILHGHSKTEAASKFTTIKLDAMLRQPPFSALMNVDSTNTRGMTTLVKPFPGGSYMAFSTKQPDNVSSFSAPLTIIDEFDRVPRVSGSEGTPEDLLEERMKTYARACMIIGGSPTDELSPTRAEFEKTDKRHFHIPCKNCARLWSPKWDDVTWQHDTAGNPIVPTVRLRCPNCGALHTNAERIDAVRDARACWIPTAPFNGRAGFYLWQIFSTFPGAGMDNILEKYIDAKRSREIVKMKSFYNTTLGLPFDGFYETADITELIARREDYGAAEIPEGVAVLTMGVDTQPDRLEAEIVGWGSGTESWSIETHVFYGDPNIPEGEPGSPWDDLTERIRHSFRDTRGNGFFIRKTMIDSGGHNATAVYRYAAAHKSEGVIAIKGSPREETPIISHLSISTRGRDRVRNVPFMIIGVWAARLDCAKNLAIRTRGPGYCHFPKSRAPEWFEQLTAERLCTDFKRGREVKIWKKRADTRNEAQDCRNYAYAAFLAGNFRIAELKAAQNRRIAAQKIREQRESVPAPETPQALSISKPAEAVKARLDALRALRRRRRF